MDTVTITVTTQKEEDGRYCAEAVARQGSKELANVSIYTDSAKAAKKLWVAAVRSLAEDLEGAAG